ncbi:MAG: alpha/beta hydrolase [Candidatus Levybacteria bacterium]|nr:alpha/beta hydrolase [Candidatus Levybacteria bacterium]
MDFAEKKGFSEIVLQGHSLGCSKVVYYFVKTLDKRISKLVLASPSDMVGLFESPSDHKNLLSLSKKMLLEGKGDEFLPKLIWGWYSLSAKTYLDFSERDNPIDIFNTYDKNKESVLAKIKIPVLAFLGEKDDAAILPIKEALAVIKKKAKNAPRFDTEVIEGAPHSYFGHEQEVADLIINWVKK